MTTSSPHKTSFLKRLLEHPATRGLDLDSPATTALRKQIILHKPCLKRIYQSWYQTLAQQLPPTPHPVLELGSGAGFAEQFFPHVLKSDLFHCPGLDLLLNAHHIPFADQSLRGIIMTNVLHHIPQPRLFFREAQRTLIPQGVIAMIEPWNNLWSRFIYTRLHHEPFLPNATQWEFPSTGPLSGANGALPWIIFHRDRLQFEKEFPHWSIRTIQPILPFRYLLSGGVSLRNLLPTPLDYLTQLLESLLPNAGMFALITLQKK